MPKQAPRASWTRENLSVGTRAALRVLPLAGVLFLLGAAGVSYLTLGPQQWLLGTVAGAGIMGFIGIPFLLAAVCDEAERIDPDQQ